MPPKRRWPLKRLGYRANSGRCMTCSINTSQSGAGSSNAKFFFESYAESLKLDVARFRADCQAADLRLRIMTEGKIGETRGAKNTPTIFINGDRSESRFHEGKVEGSDRRGARCQERFLTMAATRKVVPKGGAPSTKVVHPDCLLLGVGDHRSSWAGGCNLPDRGSPNRRRRCLRVGRWLLNRLRQLSTPRSREFRRQRLGRSLILRSSVQLSWLRLATPGRAVFSSS